MHDLTFDVVMVVVAVVFVVVARSVADARRVSLAAPLLFTAGLVLDGVRAIVPGMPVGVAVVVALAGLALYFAGGAALLLEAAKALTHGRGGPGGHRVSTSALRGAS